MAGKGYQVAVLCNLVVTTIWICSTYEFSSALERPYHLGICVLLLLGLFALLWPAWGPQSPQEQPPKDDDNVYSKLQFDQETSTRHYGGFNIGRLFRSPLRTCNFSTLSFVFLSACIAARVLILQSVVRKVECSLDGVHIILPLLLSMYEVVGKEKATHNTPRLEISRIPTRAYFIRYAFLVMVWVLAAAGTISMTSAHSTYICPSAGKLRYTIHNFQFLGLFLDAYIILAVSMILKRAQDSVKLWQLLGKLALVSAAILGLPAAVFLLISPENIGPNLNLEFKIIFNLTLAAGLVTNFAGSAIYLMADLRPSTVFLLVSCLSVYTYHFPASTAGFSGTPPMPLVILGLFAVIAVVGLFRMERDASRSQQLFSLDQNSSIRVLGGLFVFLTVIFCGNKMVLYFKPNQWAIHPITSHISGAKFISNEWQNQAGKSKSLEEAVGEYKLRYGIPPPPRFDKWYEFAIQRGSVVLDDFGQINEDLLPFWGIKPSEIREMTGHILARPWTEVGGIRISNGTTAIGPHMPPTHRWMVEGAAEMINVFAEWLPDMDLAFNINDEPRVAVPWKLMENLKGRAEISRTQLSKANGLQSFSTDTIDLWQGSFMETEPPYAPNVPSEFFTPGSFESSFQKYAIVGCPPSSPVHTQKWWNKKSHCYSCASPHSVGPILSNWTLSGSVCHQPDMENLHGFYLSPSAFAATHNPFPIFSQSKVSTFNDILFPSPWNYRAKVTYDESKDMSFREKNQTLFWRGGTSEGFSLRDTWKGMQRQRFVRAANDTDKTIHLLLPNHLLSLTNEPTIYTEQRTAVSSITSVTTIDVSFVGEPTRCWEADCIAETQEFNFGGSVDFQDHWKYKYLFDLDGAGFSGRFLPFLESKSLVFRAAIFRQWFDERVMAWRHFVPLDSRLTEVWDLLAYFGGTHSRGAHALEAETIADEGRAWAGKALRTQDMEIYMFRLLLEWGRIVNDAREGMGFVLPGVVAKE